MKKATIYAPLLAFLLLASCGDGGAFFYGVDNHVLAFSLRQDSSLLRGVVSPGLIRLSAPEGLSLNGATVALALSENATIEPDPSTISDWDEEQTFTVIARDGSRNMYHYRVDRYLRSHAENVVLLTQDDVEAFAATLDVEQLDGSLIIGATRGEDSIRTLSPLAGRLKSVTRSVIIRPTYAGASLDGLSDNLRLAGELLVDNNRIRRVQFPKLTAIKTDFAIRGHYATSNIDAIDFPELLAVGKKFLVSRVDAARADFPKLQRVAGSLEYHNVSTAAGLGTRLKHLTFPLLADVGGDLILGEMAVLSLADLPKLQRIGGAFVVRNMTTLETLSAPLLSRVSSLNLHCPALADLELDALAAVDANIQLTALETLDTVALPALETCGGTLTFTNFNLNPACFSFPRLERAGGIYISTNAKETRYHCPRLRAISGDFRVISNAITSLDGFPALESIGKRLSLDCASSLASISGLSALKEVGTIYLRHLPALKNIDLRGVRVAQLDLLGTTVPGLSLTGDDAFEGNIRLGEFPASLADISFTVQGFKIIGGMEIFVPANTPGIDFSFLERVTGPLKIGFSSTSSTAIARLPNLRSAGSLEVAQVDQLEIPLLETITGHAPVSDLPPPGLRCVPDALVALRAPLLKSIVGDLTIAGPGSPGSATAGIADARPLATISFPALEEIDGTLVIRGASNTKFSDLGGFPALTRVRGVNIAHFTRLRDFSPLRRVVPLDNPANWVVVGCAYSPTHQQMVDGAHTP
ncbi:MAG: DUF5018 domain-containing protein [Odoribacteraceae bacterium]|jgi:hypothetical protein|nr:DUF5018 domain-containing protein [Odoribacteraceae bacterium]